MGFDVPAVQIATSILPFVSIPYSTLFELISFALKLNNVLFAIVIASSVSQTVIFVAGIGSCMIKMLTGSAVPALIFSIIFFIIPVSFA